MPQISILGCGWLGLPLAKKLLETGFAIKGSTTSVEKLSLLSNAGIHPYQILLTENGPNGDIKSFLANSEILIVDIPPKLRQVSSENFVLKIRLLVDYIEQSSVKKVLFISSTSVYGESTTGLVNEGSEHHPSTESGKQLLETELILKSNPSFQTTIVRFGGLIGEDRHPVFYLAGRENVENPKAPINLIHRDDCIGIIEKIIETEIWNESFNAVTPFHPTREGYYSKKAAELNLETPKFKPDNAEGKIISSEKIQVRLNYQFQVSENI